MAEFKKSSAIVVKMLSVRTPWCPLVVRGHVEVQNFIHIQAKGIGHAFSIIRIGLVAVSDVADLNEFFGTTNIHCSIVKQFLRFSVGFYDAEEIPGLGEIVLIVIAEVVCIGVTGKFQRWFFVLGLLLPL